MRACSRREQFVPRRLDTAVFMLGWCEYVSSLQHANHQHRVYRDLPMSVCAYCGSVGPLTREHLWPRALHRRLTDSSSEKRNRFWLARIGSEIANEPTVRDVCAKCNNGVLSSLDGYICELFERSFSRVQRRYDQVEFSYEYHRLKRWLLKMCFNSARIHNSADAIVFPPLLPYIRGLSNPLGRTVQLFVQLSYPAEIPERYLESDDDRPTIYYPTVNRVGNLWFVDPGVGRKLLRAVHLQSFSFYLAFWRTDERRKEIEAFTDTFLQRLPATVLLRASKTRDTLICNGMNSWESIAEARNAQFEWA